MSIPRFGTCPSYLIQTANVAVVSRAFGDHPTTASTPPEGLCAVDPTFYSFCWGWVVASLSSPVLFSVSFPPASSLPIHPVCLFAFFESSGCRDPPPRRPRPVQRTPTAGPPFFCARLRLCSSPPPSHFCFLVRDRRKFLFFIFLEPPR